MGAWGLLFNENDDAADWLADFEDAPDWATVDAALRVADADFLEAPDAAMALAAAEVVAAALSKPSPHLEAAIAEWAAGQSDAAEHRREPAKQALVRVRDESELQELWEESDEFADWIKSVDETLSRL
jgi:hypothetical protein